MQEKAPLASGARRTKKFFDKAEFHALHEAVGKLDFTPDFNPSIEEMLLIEEVPLTEKLLALLKLQAWGNQSQLAVHDDARNRPFTQSDAARKLDVSRQRIYEAVAKLVQRCQVRAEGQRLYPVADPAAERRRNADRSSNAGNPPSAFRLWLLEHPALAEDYREAFRSIGSIKRQFREEVVSGTGRKEGAPASPRSGQASGDGWDISGEPVRTAGSPLLIVEEEKFLEQPSSSLLAVAEEAAAAEPSQTATTPSAPSNPSGEEEEPKKPHIVLEALRAYGNPDDGALHALVAACRREQADATGEEIAHFVREKGKLIGRKITNPVGFLLTAVPKCFANGSFGEYRQQRTRERSRQAAREAQDAQDAERLRQEGEADLADPNISEEEKRLIRRCLGRDDPGKNSEGAAKAAAAVLPR